MVLFKRLLLLLLLLLLFLSSSMSPSSSYSQMLNMHMPAALLLFFTECTTDAFAVCYSQFTVQYNSIQLHRYECVCVHDDIIFLWRWHIYSFHLFDPVQIKKIISCGRRTLWVSIIICFELIWPVWFLFHFMVRSSFFSMK